MDKTEYTSAGEHIWPWPDGESTALAMCWGGDGHGGAGDDSHPFGRGGGGGGAHAYRTITRGVDIDELTINVGAATEDSSVIQDGATECLAKGGHSADYRTGGLGGNKVDCIGDFVASGGAGHDSIVETTTAGGGGGGGRGNSPGDGFPGGQNTDPPGGPSDGSIGGTGGRARGVGAGRGGAGGDKDADGEDGDALGGGGGGAGAKTGGTTVSGLGRSGRVVMVCPAPTSGTLFSAGCCCHCNVEELHIPKTLFLSIAFDRSTPDGLGTLTCQNFGFPIQVSCDETVCGWNYTKFLNNAWLDLIEAACPIPLTLYQNSSGGSCCSLSYRIRSSVTVCGGTKVPHSIFLGTAPDGSFSWSHVIGNCTVPDGHGGTMSVCVWCGLIEDATVEPGEYILQAELSIDICADGTYEISYEITATAYQYATGLTFSDAGPCNEEGTPYSNCVAATGGIPSGPFFAGVYSLGTASGTIDGDWDASKLESLIMDGPGGSGSDSTISGGIGQRCVSVGDCPTGLDPPLPQTTCIEIYEVEDVNLGLFAYGAVHGQISF